TLVEFAHKYWPKKDLILFMTMNNEGSANVARSAGFVPLMEKGKQVVKTHKERPYKYFVLRA
ncbi:MAG: hypothetical protein OXC30_04725, partial [Alphaproteobacteria bacterium]|nr:hypothetical protein [Alphaproteobacteria bacterium]